jgi:hypothetical protein
MHDMWLSAQGLPADLSATVLATLALMLGGAVAVFSLLARQLTIRRRQTALNAWAARREAQILRRPPPDTPVTNLEVLGSFHPHPRVIIQNRRWTLADLTTDPPVEAKGNIPRWHVLAINQESGPLWAPTGLRPVVHDVSVVDLPALSSYPSLVEGERFMLFGADSAAAQALADSPAQRLLPADIGLLLQGRSMVLDFSTRPFEPAEFDRMIALAEQLTQYFSQRRVKSGAGNVSG